MLKKKNKPRGMPKSVAQGSRILGKTGARPTNLFASPKISGIATLESALEKGVAQLATLDPRVISIKGQPFTVDVVSGHLSHSRTDLLEHRTSREKSNVTLREYTPDFLIALTSGIRVVVEVKDDRYLGDELYWKKVRQAEQILLANGYAFLVIAMKYEQSNPLLQNAELLTAFPKKCIIQLSQEQLAVANTLISDGPTALGLLCEKLNISTRQSPSLLLSGLVNADLKKVRLGPKTMVGLANGNLDHFHVLPLPKGLA